MNTIYCHKLRRILLLAVIVGVGVIFCLYTPAAHAQRPSLSGLQQQIDELQAENDAQQTQIDDLRTETGRTGVLSVPTQAFRWSWSRMDTEPFCINNDDLGHGAAYCRTDSDRTLIAPINLPHGASIISLTMYFWNCALDTSDPHLDVTLKAHRHLSWEEAESITPTMSSYRFTGVVNVPPDQGGCYKYFSKVVTPDPARAFVDNAQYSYFIEVTPVPKWGVNRILGAMIIYEIGP